MKMEFNIGRENCPLFHALVCSWFI